MTSVSPVDACVKGELRFHDDSYIAGHRKLTDTVHAFGKQDLYVGGDDRIGEPQRRRPSPGT